MSKLLKLKIQCLILVCISGLVFAKQRDQSNPNLKGKVRVDGSSTVFPITEAVGEEFQKLNRRVRVTVGVSGTGGGMKKFTAGETDITGASRPIRKTERDLAFKNRIQFIELPVAYDGIAVVVNPKNTFVKTLKVEELKRIWQPNSNVTYWSDVNPAWPKKRIRLYGPGADSGTFDYFTKAIVGKSKSIRPDFTASEDDNVLVQGISGDQYALGYFGYAYYAENKNRLKLVGITAAGKEPVFPSSKTIEDGTYRPLSRPVFIYVNQQAAARPEVEKFVMFYLQNAYELVPQVGYVPLKKILYDAALGRFQKRLLGTVFGSKKFKKTAKMEELLKRKGD